MSYVPDFVSWLCFFGSLGFSAGVLYWIVLLDEELQNSDQKRLWKRWFVFGSIILLGLLCGEGNHTLQELLSLCILEVYLVVCTVLDSQLCKVNDFMQYVGLLGGGIAALYRIPKQELGIELLMFVLVQYVLFRKMYGAADVMAFSICALYLAGEGRGLEHCLYHMAVCYLLLGFVQALKKNIGRNGQLKYPVPLYPYISVSFLLIICQ